MKLVLLTRSLLLLGNLSLVKLSLGKLFLVNRRWILSIGLLFFTSLSYAQTTTAKAPAAEIGSGRHLVSVTFALLGIIGLIFAISWFVKRFSQGGFAASSHIKIISAMPLGTRERIVLIDAGGQQLLLGITPTNINTLHVFETPIAVDNKIDTQSDFSRKLMAILQQKSPSTPAPDSTHKNDSAH